ncbi:hypothetical protein HMI56_001635 [Coelomomyces lativittatus]|nr:hypothetical protein HMI56_001635 [Coelomomyces lativittatus]
MTSEQVIPLQQQVEQLSQLCRKQEQQIQKYQQDHQKLHADFKSQQELLHELRLDSQHMRQQLNELQQENEALLKEKELQEASKLEGTAAVCPRSSFSSHENGSFKFDPVHVETYYQASQRLLNSVSEGSTPDVLTHLRQMVVTCNAFREHLTTLQSSTEDEHLMLYQNQLSTHLTPLLEYAKQVPIPMEAFMQTSTSLTETLKEMFDHVGVQPHSFMSLKLFLGTHTDTIVRAIQDMLSALRLSQFNESFLTIIHRITSTVTTLSKECQLAFDQVPMLHHFKPRGEPVLHQLIQCNAKLNELGMSMVKEPESKLNRQKLASASYEL